MNDTNQYMINDYQKHILNIVKQILSSDFTENDGVFFFKEKNKPSLKFNRNEIIKTLNQAYSTFTTLYDDEKDFRDIMMLILIGTRIKTRFNFEELDKKFFEKIVLIRQTDKRNFMEAVNLLFDNKKYQHEVIKSCIDPYMEFDGLYVDEAVHICTTYMGKDLFDENKSEFIELSLLDKDMINGLLEQNFINEEDIKKCLSSTSKQSIFDAFKEYQKSIGFLLNYMEPALILEMFYSGIIDQKVISKYISVDRLISAGIDKNSIMSLIKEKVLDAKCEMDLWNLYESNYFSENEMDTIVRMSYINPKNIIEKYNQSQKRNIAVALEEIPGISIESLAKFLSPQRIISLENSNRADRYDAQSKQFVRSELREIYSMQGRDLELDLLQEQKQRNEAQEDKSKQKPLIDLYKSRLVSLSKFEEEDISLDEIIRYYEENKDLKILIEANNAGILSNLDLVELLEDFDKIFDLIEKGLNPTILNEFCGIQDILDLYKTEKVSTENLSKLTINKDKLKDLYVSEKIEYEDLDIIHQIGLITIEERDKIEQEYDIEAKLEELRKTGILGKDGSELHDVNYSNTAINIEIEKQNSKMTKEEKILSDAKVELFKRLGASEPVCVKCDLFKDYTMYPIVDKRLAIFEGKNGATYIFPLKVVLEQVGKDLKYIKENNLIGQAENRRKLYENKTVVRRVMHTCNWGVQLIEKMQDLNPIIDANQLREDCKDLTEDIREYYKLCSNAKTEKMAP